MHPYLNLNEKCFWAPAVGKRDPLQITDLWDPKWPIQARHKIVTFGSCFAQHIGKAMVSRRYNWMDTEPAPEGMAPETAKTYNYGVFSARTGNIYTTNMLRQWVEWSLGKSAPPEELWEKDGRYFDPFRPAIEPDGFVSREEAFASRARTIEAFGDAIRECDTFVFTLGLTESWQNPSLGCEYALCPGTLAGTFDPEQHVFVNQSFSVIRANLAEAIRMMRRENPRMRILLTVSPVPLTATASGQHVLVATIASKSILRAVAAELVEVNPKVDYFPSYEIISSPPFRGMFFEENQRSVRPDGVAHVMDCFFKSQTAKFRERPAQGKVATKIPAQKASEKNAHAKSANIRRKVAKNKDDLVCEEQLLSAFGPKGGQR